MLIDTSVISKDVALDMCKAYARRAIMELDYIFFLRATRKFYEVELIDFNIGDELIGFDLVGDDGYIFHSNSGEGDICKFIGINDIDGKKIYADSSIFEFETEIGKRKGYFTFCEKTLRYHIFDLALKAFVGYSLLYKNFKIIDTIQENKLGLVWWVLIIEVA